MLQELQTKLKYGHSQAQLEEHLENASRLLGCDGRLPTNYQTVLSLLQSLGYKDAKHFKVCVQSSTHHFLLEDKKQHPCCPVCSKPWEECVDYYVLGLQFCNWFSTNQQCEMLMAHWHSRSEWLNKPIDYEPHSYSELWHGSRFRELSYFWDRDQETLLPHKCPTCAAIVPVAEVSNLIDPNSPDGLITTVCKVCADQFSFRPEYMKGDPRNKALIIHFDIFFCASRCSTSKLSSQI